MHEVTKLNTRLVFMRSAVGLIERRPGLGKALTTVQLCAESMLVPWRKEKKSKQTTLTLSLELWHRAHPHALGVFCRERFIFSFFSQVSRGENWARGKNVITKKKGNNNRVWKMAIYIVTPLGCEAFLEEG